MTYIFDGREFAKKKEEILKNKVQKLVEKGITPKLISIIVGNDPASKLYVSLKKKAGERIGCEVNIIGWNSNTRKREIIDSIKIFNRDKSVSGIMVQLPLPKGFSLKDRDEILNSIDPKKDVDGLMDNSIFITPTAKAVMEVLHKAIIVRHINKKDLNVVVMGSKGFEGRKIIESLRKENFDVTGINKNTKNKSKISKNADVLISVTGVSDLIKSDMVKKDSILIDVGSPNGDIEKGAYNKASFVSPVPGGVGPITISCLLENLIEASN